MDCKVHICSSLHTFLSPKESLETPFLAALLAIPSVRLAIDQHVIKEKGSNHGPVLYLCMQLGDSRRGMDHRCAPHTTRVSLQVPTHQSNPTLHPTVSLRLAVTAR